MISITRRTIEIAAFIAVLLIAAMALHAWLDSHDEQTRLTAALAAQKKLLDAADSRETARQSALDTSLAQIEALKRTTVTPEQILRALPQYLRLPQPMTLVTPPVSKIGPPGIRKPEKGTAPSDESPTVSAAPRPSSPSTTVPTSKLIAPTGGLPARPVAQIPAADLQPLYDYVQDCRACQARLAAANQDKLDDDSKISALQHERDAALTAAKGGTFWRRFRRNALWFAIGAVTAGAASTS